MKTIQKILITLLITILYANIVMAQENQSYILHTVEKGQSLYSISRMYSVEIADIVKQNPGSEEKIRIGSTLRIPRNQVNTPELETYHTIKAGETLYGLGVKYNVSGTEICKANPGLSATNFKIGQVILIPKVASAPVKEVQATTTPQQNQMQGPVIPKCREMHKVKRKETVYSISRQYGITEDELLEANPELNGKKKIKRGTFLCIPYAKKQKEEIIRQTAPSNTELLAEVEKQKKDITTIKAAVILPFLDGVPSSEALRMVEYYEGFLMAVDSLKRRGTSIDLYTYNSGPETSSITPILNKSEMKQMDIIFGPLYQSHIDPLAKFAEQNNIRLVIPFTSKDDNVFQNPSIYQINTQQSYLYSEVYDHFVRQFPNANVIFIEASQGAKEKETFIKGLKDELRNRAIPMTNIKDTVTIATLPKYLDKERVNIFVPTSGSNITLISILPHLQLLVREHAQIPIHLFGYPEWQTYTKDHLDTFFELDTYFYSSFYTNNLLPAAINFTNNYRRQFGKDMIERYPKFGMLGFDTAYFFLYGLSRYGSDLEDNLQHMNVQPIQTGFKFQRVNNWGGFVNKKVFFIRFTKNYELVKLDFD